jgi:predicted lipid-binding transport protein (Tim44 family)
VGTPSSLPAYDPKIIEQFADKLYRKASAFVAGSVVIGASLGAAFGAVPLSSLGSAWPIPSYLGFATLLLGGLLGGLIGYVIGDTRSFGYRLQAQSALCQLQSERNTAILARAVSASSRVSAPAPRQAQPVPQAASAPPAAAEARPAAPEEQPPGPPQPPLSPPVSAVHVA